MTYIRLLVISIALGVLFSEPVSVVERSGDIIQAALPIAGLATSYYLNDKIGKNLGLYTAPKFLSSPKLKYTAKIIALKKQTSK